MGVVALQFDALARALDGVATAGVRLLKGRRGAFILFWAETTAASSGQQDTQEYYKCAAPLH